MLFTAEPSLQPLLVLLRPPGRHHFFQEAFWMLLAKSGLRFLQFLLSDLRISVSATSGSSCGLCHLPKGLHLMTVAPLAVSWGWGKEWMNMEPCCPCSRRGDLRDATVGINVTQDPRPEGLSQSMTLLGGGGAFK